MLSSIDHPEKMPVRSGVRDEVPEPLLGPEELRAFAKGVDQFNHGDYFGCHDTLEDLWAGVRGPSRDFFQGLIQVSVGLYHLTRGNRAGADSVLRRALSRLRKYPGLYWGFDLDAHRAEIARWLAAIAASEAGSRDLEAPPSWRFTWLHSDSE